MRLLVLSGSGRQSLHNKAHPTFRKFVENLGRYVSDFKSRMMLVVSSTVRFKFGGMSEVESWNEGEPVTFRDALKFRLADMGHKVRIEEDGTLVAKKGWRYFPGVKCTIKIDRDGSGAIESTTHTDDYWTFEDVELCTWYKHGSLVEAMRCLRYHFEKIRLIPKGAPK